MPNITVDSHILNAINSYMHDNRVNLKEFAALCGVSSPAAMKWRRKGNSIRETAWNRLFPLIRSRLSDNLIGVDEDGREYYIVQKEDPSKKCDCLFVPMFTEEEMEMFVPSLDTPEKYAASIGAQNVPFVPRAQNRLFSDIFCLCVGQGMANGVMPSGTRIFASSRLNDFMNSSCSVARIDGRIQIVTFSKDGESITFRRLADGGTLAVGTLRELSSHISWIFPVLYYEVGTYTGF